MKLESLGPFLPHPPKTILTLTFTLTLTYNRPHNLNPHPYLNPRIARVTAKVCLECPRPSSQHLPKLPPWPQPSPEPWPTQTSFLQPESLPWPQSNLITTLYPNQTIFRSAWSLTPQFGPWHYLNPSYPNPNIPGTPSDLCNPDPQPNHPKPTLGPDSSLSDPDPLQQLKKENNEMEESNENLMPMPVHIIYFILIHIVF